MENTTATTQKATLNPLIQSEVTTDRAVQDIPNLGQNTIMGILHLRILVHQVVRYSRLIIVCRIPVNAIMDM
ncbi:MAG: hypothetical protein A3I29_00655 [Candidatus Magasanikbacteria bacterium RIFCSPLOWO2_02_FULL_44_11]|uniref:Uncharacterized protein n=1 Tax=Candidatus Magasanikbacteria bacterium RIFCSPLOWO2_02_FULL_44_11 TaxID=1798689 RepID=A0A1F6NAG4_9BACT|nr:MAG: hypothetical protein A3I29_00655 [Candidatus Magasanikbacteria bacterium RIFCSPLOWO2_02_FULL_44_11]